MYLAMILIAFLVAAVSFINWVIAKISLISLAWYLDKKGYPSPTSEEMKE